MWEKMWEIEGIHGRYGMRMIDSFKVKKKCALCFVHWEKKEKREYMDSLNALMENA